MSLFRRETALTLYHKLLHRSVRLFQFILETLFNVHHELLRIAPVMFLLNFQNLLIPSMLEANLTIIEILQFFFQTLQLLPAHSYLL
jgi:hypothetical protein